MNILKLVGIVVLICIVSGCKIKSKIMKTEFEIEVGETFRIELASSPSTGYSWKWVNQQDVSAVDTVGHQFIEDSPGKIGGGGTEIWNFKGLKSGTDVIKLEYNRSWESGPAANTETIAVKVK